MLVEIEVQFSVGPTLHLLISRRAASSDKHGRPIQKWHGRTESHQSVVPLYDFRGLTPLQTRPLEFGYLALSLSSISSR